MFHSIVGFENDVHVHEHVNVDEDVIVDMHVLVEVDGFGCDQAP